MVGLWERSDSTIGWGQETLATLASGSTAAATRKSSLPMKPQLRRGEWRVERAYLPADKDVEGLIHGAIEILCNYEQRHEGEKV